MDKCSKLPDIIRFDDYDGQWELYEEELYKVFKNAFIESEKKFITIKKKHFGMLYRKVLMNLKEFQIFVDVNVYAG